MNWKKFINSPYVLLIPVPVGLFAVLKTYSRGEVKTAVFCIVATVFFFVAFLVARRKSIKKNETPNNKRR